VTGCAAIRGCTRAEQQTKPETARSKREKNTPARKRGAKRIEQFKKEERERQREHIKRPPVEQLWK
jgi:hypothetical protein